MEIKGGLVENMTGREIHAWLIFINTFLIVFSGMILYAITGGDVKGGWGGAAVALGLFAGVFVTWQYWLWTDS